MGCSSDVLKKTSPLDVFGDVSEKVKHLTNDGSNNVSPPALAVPLAVAPKIRAGLSKIRTPWKPFLCSVVLQYVLPCYSYLQSQTNLSVALHLM